jgi:hypothetical protein
MRKAINMLILRSKTRDSEVALHAGLKPGENEMITAQGLIKANA